MALRARIGVIASVLSVLALAPAASGAGPPVFLPGDAPLCAFATSGQGVGAVFFGEVFIRPDGPDFVCLPEAAQAP